MLNMFNYSAPPCSPPQSGHCPQAKLQTHHATHPVYYDLFYTLDKQAGVQHRSLLRTDRCTIVGDCRQIKTTPSRVNRTCEHRDHTVIVLVDSSCGGRTCIKVPPLISASSRGKPSELMWDTSSMCAAPAVHASRSSWKFLTTVMLLVASDNEVSCRRFLGRTCML